MAYLVSRLPARERLAKERRAEVTRIERDWAPAGWPCEVIVALKFRPDRRLTFTSLRGQARDPRASAFRWRRTRGREGESGAPGSDHRDAAPIEVRHVARRDGCFGGACDVEDNHAPGLGASRIGWRADRRSSTPPSGRKRRRIASARSRGEAASSARIARKIFRASSSIERLWCAARTRRHALVSSSRLRIVTLANAFTPSNTSVCNQ